jgi:hypothetical protein
LHIDTATAASSAARTERTQRLNQTLNEVLPLLEKISDSKGKLTNAERVKAQLTEAELRDQIRGRNLLSIDVVSETRNARMRGIEVQLLDDGGLDDLSQEDRKPYLWEVASRLKGVKAGKVVVRAARGILGGSAWQPFAKNLTAPICLSESRAVWVGLKNVMGRPMSPHLPPH